LDDHLGGSGTTSVQSNPASSNDDDIAQRFLNAGVVVPADRAEGAFGAARRLLAALHWLRRPRTAAAEPAHIFVAEKANS
jgi:hypothetical protein